MCFVCISFFAYGVCRPSEARQGESRQSREGESRQSREGESRQGREITHTKVTLHVIVQRCYHGITVFYSGVTVVLQWLYSGVTVVLEWCHSGVTVVLQWCYSGLTCTESTLHVVVKLHKALEPSTIISLSHHWNTTVKPL
jgi:hypothetical protein